VIGTMNILAACSGPDSNVRKLVFKSSAHYYGTAQDDPAFFTEAMGRPHPPTTQIERDILEAEAAVNEYGEQNPGTTVTVLRCANVLGPDVRTTHTSLFALPAVPMILGFDPRYQFVHEDDVVGALAHVLRSDLAGVYNVAADGVLAFSEVVGLLGKPYLPILPPWGTGLAATLLKPVGLDLPPEVLSQLRFGRGLDNRKLKATGFQYRYTSRETAIKLAEHLRLAPILRGVQEPFTYERDVEDFLRWSPHVRGSVPKRERGRGREPEPVEPEPIPVEEAILASGEPVVAEPEAAEPPVEERQPAESPVEHYDDLEAEEVISLLGSLEAADLESLLEYERERLARAAVLTAIEAVLSRRAMGSHP
jgi:UDP-glucose 4-epimerase